MLLPVTKIQKFCTHDGPGIRTTVFLKGCPLRCLWCHNPETQSLLREYFYSPQFCLECRACSAVCPADVHVFTDVHRLQRDACTGCMACAASCPSGALEACAQEMSADEILQEVLKDRAFYGTTGGLTLSGGEPLLHGYAVLPILAGAKASGITTAIETCGVFDSSLLAELVPLTDLFLWDVKDTDTTRHQQNTGGSLERVLSNLRTADALGARSRLRCILLSGINLNDAHLHALTELYHSLQHCEGIELLPYHTFGDDKNLQLGRPSAAHPEWIPGAEEMAHARTYIRERAVLIGG